ncbi:unnamed protein product [Prorocentrum cordatum]|uniref:Copia protein n=1 Tax=Prorocentrum cordatum TaxID=2364126 RepID=A0ABN9U2B0_9DINO|nr:unnamed protein product [Polarella glacialis]
MASTNTYNSAVDPKIPVLKGETLKDFTRYKRAVQAAELGCESKEQKIALEPKLYRNLLGADNSIRVLIEQTGPKDYAVEKGAEVLLKFFEAERFAKSSFRELPKAFDTLFDLTYFERKGVDPDMKVSSHELGYHTLKQGRLDKDERNLDDDGYWYEWDDERGVYACADDEDEDADWESSHLFYIEDDADAYLAAAGGKAAGKSSGKGKGKGKDGGKSKMVSMDSDPIVPDRPELEVMISSDVVPPSLMDSGASIAVAGRGWLDRVDAELAKYGLKPIKLEAHQKFNGLGRTRRESKQKWIIPVGIGKKHVLQDGHWADFQELGVHGKELVKLPGGHAGFDLFDYDLESYQSEPLFERFRVEEMQPEPDAFLVAEALREFEPGFQVKDHADSWVAEALKNGSKGIFKKGTLKRIDKLMKEYSVILDVLRDSQETFPWELFTKEARFTRVASKGGHANATPSDLSVGVNFNDPQIQSDLLILIKTFEPWMVDDLIEEFRPLVDFSAKVLRTQPEGGRIGIGENPLTSRAWNEKPIVELLRWHGDRPPLCEMVTLHRCMFGLTDDYRTPIRKVPDQQTMRTVAKEFRLRKDLIDVRVLRQNEAVPLPRVAVRRIYAMYTDKDVLADFSHAYADDPNFATVEPATRYPTDTVVAIYVKEPKVKASATSPSDIATAQWGALWKIHLNLSHPSAHALKRRLKSYGVSQKMLDAVDELDCVACKELGRPNTTRSVNLKLDGRVERAIDSFKDHSQRLNRDVQLTKSDDPSVWTSVIASTCNNHIGRNGFTRAEQIRAATNWAFLELDSDDAVRRATVGRVRPPRGPFVPGQLVFYWREVKHVKSKRLQGEHGWRGPAFVLAAEGHTRLHLSYRGVPVLVAPEQVRHASRGEAEMVENEDLARQLSQWRGGPTLQKGFVDERGPGPDGSGGQHARRCKKDDGDSDNEDATGDAPAAKTPRCYPKYHHYLEMDTTCRTSKLNHYPEMDTKCKTSELKTYPEMAMACQMLRLTTHLHLLQLGRGVLRNDLYLTTSKQIANDFACVLKLSSNRLPRIEDDKMDDEVLSLKVKKRSRGAFVARRTDAAKKQVAPKKGRELRSIPPEWKAAFLASDLEAKSRNIVPGYKDKQLLAGELQTNAPTLTDTATAVITQEAASQPGWSLEQGDVDSAFLNGRYISTAPGGHRDATLSLPGASRSKLCPALFIFHDEKGKLISLIGTHVDDDLVAGSPKFFANQVAKLRKEYTESIEKIHISAERRKTKEAKATLEERAMLHSGKGQIQWLVRSTRMDLAPRLVESQARAHDSDLTVQDLLDYNKLVSDAKTDHVEGMVILFGGNADDQFLRGRPAKVTPMLWRSRRIKRVVWSTLAAETMAALEAVENGDMLRQRLMELHHGLGYWTHMDDVKAIKMVGVTDCKSLYDLLQKRGTVPSEKRLLIDIESLRNDIEFNSVVSKWVNTKQMLADCLSKQDVRAGDYMRYVLRTGEYRLTEDPMAEQVISEQGMELKGRRGEYYRSKYPRRHRPADQTFVREGYPHFEDCIADLGYNAHAARPAPKHYLRWRMMLGQREDDIHYEKLKDMVDWSGLDQVAKRRRIPTQARKLLTIYARTKEALERYEKDFTETHNLKKTDMTKDIEHHENTNVISDEGVLVESDESQNTDGTADLDDAKEIYMTDAAGAETEEIGGGAAGAGTTLVACAVCRMVVDQCECQPRTRKKANHNVPVPNDGDEWVEVPGETEKSRESTSKGKTTELPMDKARKLHERLKHASYKQVEHDLDDVLEDDILEAYQLVVARCSKCRRASCDTEDIPKGKGNETGKGKSRSTCRVDPDGCIHPADQLTTVGTNQYKEKVRCRLCDTLLVDRDTKRWSEEKELRAEVKAIRLEKQKQELLSRSRAPTAGRSSTK